MKNPLLTPIKIACFAAPLLFWAACSTPDNATDGSEMSAVNPPFENEVPFRDFDINTAAADTILLSEGTRMYIPSGIFVDDAGNPVNGKVDLHYRAYYTPGEIIASGITMHYDSAGQAGGFVSAGMFELTGTQNGKPVRIAPGKSIEMDFASSRNDMTFSLYGLDTAGAGKWNFLTTTKADSNAFKKMLRDQLAVLPPKPVAPVKLDPAKPAINIDADLTDHPELSGYNGIVWQYAGTGSDPEQNDWVYTTNWTKVDLKMNDENTCTYQMSLSDNTRSFSTNVVPALSGSNYTRAQTSYKENLAKYEAKQEVVQEIQDSAQTVLPYQRRLTINSFGSYNCDMYVRFGSPVNADFTFEDAEMQNARYKVTVYVISSSGTISLAYNAMSSSPILYDSGRDNCLVAVVNGTSKIALLNRADTKAAAAKGTRDAMKFKLNSSSRSVKNAQELDELVAEL